MATITPTQFRPPTGSKSATPNVIQTTWASIGDADTCTSVQAPDFPDQTVQVLGTFGGATVIMQGSNDNATFFGLTDPLGNAISFTATGGKTLLNAPRWIRPSSGSGSSSSTTVILESRR